MKNITKWLRFTRVVLVENVLFEELSRLSIFA